HLLIHAKKLFVNTDGHRGFEFARNNQPHWKHHTQQALATTRDKHTLAA
ncbi:MAG: hypothetical protein JWP10_1042, partial [Nocardioidaceae bacterium]|nr:hypothetical protein [Nocardioidaceae bacterium]